MSTPALQPGAVPVTAMQAGMLVVSSESPRSGAYLQQVAAELDEALDLELFREAWRQVIDRHGVLRTRFRADPQSGWLQEPAGGSIIPVNLWDWDQHEEGPGQRTFENLLSLDRRRGFDLVGGAPSRISIARAGARQHWFVWSYHHALLDGRSYMAILDELFTIYDALRLGQEPSLPPPPDHSEFLEWRQAQDWSVSRDFWRGALAGAQDINTDFGGRARPNYLCCESEPHTVRRRLSQNTSARLESLAQRAGVTLNTVSQGAWALLMSCYTGEDEVLLGAVKSCRRSLPERLRDVAGLVINTLPMRIRVDPEQSIADWLGRIRSQWVALRAHELSAVTSIRQWCDWSGSKPFFGSIHVHENVAETVCLRGLDRKRAFRSVVGRTEAPASVSTYGPDPFEAVALVDPELFDDAEATELGERYRCLLEGLAAHPDGKLGDLGRLTPWERRRALIAFNQHPQAPAAGATVLETFQQQARVSEHHPAVVSDGGELSYRQLLDVSTGLAEHVRELANGKVAGILMGPGTSFVVAMLSTLIAETGFVPLDPDYPDERLAFLARDSGARVLLTEQKHQEKAVRMMRDSGRDSFVLVPGTNISEVQMPVVEAVSAGSGLPTSSTRERIPGLVYLVYTSGTTGEPKGVPITSENLMPLMLWQRDHFGIGARTRMIETLSVSFDFGLQEILTTLLFGGTLYCPEPLVLMDPEQYVAFLRRYRISMVYATPSFMEVIVSLRQRLDSLRVILLGGERLHWDLVDALLPLLHPDCVVFNGYGPTEATINCAMYPLGPGIPAPQRRGASVPIGTPTGRARLYVLDHHRRPVPIGVPGELYIGGPGVAGGYFRRTALTGPRFVADPFDADPSSRLYRSGDRVKLRTDGLLEFLGRVDNQVKFRGYRIELEEIESTLVGFPGLRSAAVVIEQPPAGETRLTAFVVADRERTTAADVRQYVRGKLPGYMVPARICFVDALPLTRNGKVDRNRLSSLDPGPVAPETGAVPSRVPRRLPFEEWFNIPVWRENSRRHESVSSGRWLLLGDGSAFETKLVEAIRDAGHTLSLFPASKWHNTNCEALFEELNRNHSLPDTVICLDLNDRSHPVPPPAFDPDFAGLLLLLRTIGEHYRTRPLRLGMVTANAQAVTGNDLLYPRRALSFGLCQTIPLELPRVACTAIDIDERQPGDLVLARELVADMELSPPQAPIAYRNGRRYVRSFQRQAPPTAGPAIRAGCTYLITGGLGSLGLAFAEALSAEAPVNLILLDTPEATAADGGVEALKRSRGEVLVARADVTDSRQLTAALDHARKRFGRIHGAIHAAGCVGQDVIRNLTPDRAAPVLGPKVWGTEILAEAVAPDRPEFVLLCSSIDAIRGSFSQAAYCAANTFLDAFALRMSQLGSRYVAVNWDAWRDVGMAARVAVSRSLEAIRRDELELGISRNEGMRALLHLLRSREAQVVVSTTPLASRIGSLSPTLAAAASSAEISQVEPAESPVEQRVLDVLADVLENGTVHPEDDFFSMGGDSFTAMRVVARLRDEFGIDLPFSSLFEAPTAKSLAELLRNELAGAS